MSLASFQYRLSLIKLTAAEPRMALDLLLHLRLPCTTHLTAATRLALATLQWHFPPGDSGRRILAIIHWMFLTTQFRRQYIIPLIVHVFSGVHNRTAVIEPSQIDKQLTQGLFQK